MLIIHHRNIPISSFKPKPAIFFSIQKICLQVFILQRSKTEIYKHDDFSEA